MTPVGEDSCAPRCCAHISLRRRTIGPTYSQLDPLYSGGRVKTGMGFMHLRLKFSLLHETISIISMRVFFAYQLAKYAFTASPQTTCLL